MVAVPTQGRELIDASEQRPVTSLAMTWTQLVVGGLVLGVLMTLLVRPHVWAGNLNGQGYRWGTTPFAMIVVIFILVMVFGSFFISN